MINQHHSPSAAQVRSATPPLPERLYLTEAEVEAVYGLSRAFLQKRRVVGGGPAFHHAGRKVLYARRDIEAWLAAGRRVSTSDEGRLA